MMSADYSWEMDVDSVMSEREEICTIPTEIWHDYFTTREASRYACYARLKLHCVQSNRVLVPAGTSKSMLRRTLLMQ
jgi:hypothetical protein